jgi:hypothetical protein
LCSGEQRESGKQGERNTLLKQDPVGRGIVVDLIRDLGWKPWGPETKERRKEGKKGGQEPCFDFLFYFSKKVFSLFIFLFFYFKEGGSRK